MKKQVVWIVVLVLATVFVFAASQLGSILFEYWSAQHLYTEMAAQVVTESPVAADGPSPAGENASGDADALPEAPIKVDFDTLRAVNPDVIGWIYSPGTIINYPILQGTDNDYYLHHSMDGTYSGSASIFVDSYNRRDFQDANTIIYGHHMKSGSMFASIENYADQAYYEEHPVMWILTPEQNYQVVLFSAYTTPANSDTYRIYDIPGKALDTYIAERLALSDIQTDVTFTGEDKLVVLSTCAYVFNNARYVVHGILRPAA